MVYRVALVEFGRCSHSWLYDNYSDAINQLNHLCAAFDEVNEVTPILLKCGPHEAQLPLKGLITHLILSNS